MILGLHGKMNAGKNECARRLVNLSPLPVVEVSFAAKLKESAAALLDLDAGVLETAKNDPYARVCLTYLEPGGSNDILVSQTVRSFLQRYGTEAHRDVFGQDFWLDAALPVQALGYADALYVVTDVRFPNEAQRVRDLGGWVVLVVGPDDDTGTHPSEQTIEPHLIEATIINTSRDDDFASLDRQLSELMFMAFGGSRAA